MLLLSILFLATSLPVDASLPIQAPLIEENLDEESVAFLEEETVVHEIDFDEEQFSE